MFPILGKIGPLTFYSYGLMMALGFWCATQIASREFARRGGDPEHFWKLALGAFVAGLVSSHLVWWTIEALAGRAGRAELLSGAGHIWYAGLIGGLVCGWLLARHYAVPVMKALDSAALGIPVGHALGRIGCHLAGDGDWGTVTDLPWNVEYPNGIATWPHPPGVGVHPTPIYEALAYGAVFWILFKVVRHQPGQGRLLGWALILTSIARFAIEFIRVNPRHALGFSAAQWTAIALFTFGAWLLTRPEARSAREA